MQIKIKRFDTSLPLPQYKTAGAAALDLCARLDTTIEPKTFGYIPLNVAVEVPAGYWILIAARGSTHKQGLMLANGIGIGDADFCGDNDEYQFAAYNFTDKPITIERGQRIAQMMVLPIEAVEIEEVAKLEGPDRGKFGTTGTH